MSGTAAPDEARGKTRACPVCGKPSVGEAKPFCSRRCADIDLGRWLKGRYAVPAEEAPDPDAEPEDR